MEHTSQVFVKMVAFRKTEKRNTLYDEKCAPKNRANVIIASFTVPKPSSNG